MEGIIVRRAIPSEHNNCLFAAVGYVMARDPLIASMLRSTISVIVYDHPEMYSDAFLGMSNRKYISWVLDPKNPGGAVELTVLANYCGREIAAYDIQSSRCYLYGQQGNYSERVMLIYDGIQYGALVLSPYEGALKEFDETIFPVQGNRSIGPVEGLVANFVKDEQRKRGNGVTLAPVDSILTLPISLCAVGCAQIGVVGQKEAVEHAQATGHFNFKKL